MILMDMRDEHTMQVGESLEPRRETAGIDQQPGTSLLIQQAAMAQLP
jgi:hypothetical protein